MVKLRGKESGDDHVTIYRKMSNGDSLGTRRIPITHLKDTH